MGNDQDVFRFELNESLFFERGQEVGEMMGVSLDPEISIQSFHDYISIRGVIELHGTYQKETAANGREEGSADLENDYQSRRYVEKVENIADDQAEFTHQFPVEISVPANRVTDLDDVTVGIESLDYEIPDQTQLKLNAVIEIQGIANEMEGTDEAGVEAEQASLPRNEETFDFDVKMKNEDEEEESEEMDHPENTPVLPDEPIKENEQEAVLDTGAESQPAEEDATDEKGRWKAKKSQTLAEFFGTQDKKEHEADMEGANEQTETEADNAESPSDESPSLATFPDSDGWHESDESSIEPEDVRYLADMFRSDEEEQYAKMRLCIVQETDTVESIAQRYGISALQLLKQNRLGDESLEEGQLLYIPPKKETKKET
ncbi:stage VI sporulation protein D [Lentibacillus lipolyticus]|nr:stage VI sporulation protein D [Lentibacillus lipolyticus]